MYAAGHRPCASSTQAWVNTGQRLEQLVMVWQVQTEMMGDIHHYAWRARHRNQTVYINKRDSERFGDWTSEQCAVSQPRQPHQLCPITKLLHIILILLVGLLHSAHALSFTCSNSSPTHMSNCFSKCKSKYQLFLLK